MRTDPHEHKHAPGMTPRSHRHVLTEVDVALAGLIGRLDALEEAMANVVLTVSQLPGPVTPPVVDPVVPVTPPVDPPIVPVVITGPAYYISPTGSDVTGNGTQTYPWASVAKFLAKPPRPGDTLYVRGGTHTAAGNRSNYVRGISGTSGSPITIRNYPEEVVTFDGGSGVSHFLIFTNANAPSAGGAGCNYWVLDGLNLLNHYPDGTGELVFGNWNDDDTTVHRYNIIRNCTFRMMYGDAPNYGEHNVYLGGGAGYFTIEDCRFLGRYNRPNTTGAAIHCFHPPGGPGHVFQRNIIDNYEDGIQVFQAGFEADILHNSFLRCGNNIRIDRHDRSLIRDNAGNSGTIHDIYEDTTYGDYTANSTITNNFWGQTFDASYYLLPGNTGIDAASDGKDAGALDS